MYIPRFDKHCEFRDFILTVLTKQKTKTVNLKTVALKTKTVKILSRLLSRDETVSRDFTSLALDNAHPRLTKQLPSAHHEKSRVDSQGRHVGVGLAKLISAM
jgi:hypothetical protein